MLGFLLRKDWPAPYRQLYIGHLVVLLVLMGMLLVSMYGSPYNVFGWTVHSTTELIQIPLHHFDLGLFQVEIPTNNYLINQHFSGSGVRFADWQVLTHMLAVGISIVMVLTVVTYFSTFWYTVAMGIFIVFLMALQLDQLQVFGFTGKETVIAMIIAFLLATYYIHAWATALSFFKRWLVLLSFVSAVVALLLFFAQVDQPLLHLANFGVFGPVILSVLFLLIIGIEIVYLILYLITQAPPQFSKHNFRHFLIFGIIYLINVGLAYAKAAQHIDWDILYINAFILACTSILIGLWSFGKREEGYENIMVFYPFGGLLFLALGIICISTIHYQTIMGNDPLLETLEDAILFGHLGFGGMFFIYILANFITPLIKNLQVYKIAFKETNFPFATANLASMVVVLALYFMGDQASLNQAIAGMYNLGADIWQTKNTAVAKQMYYQSTFYGFNNHRANYMLGMIEKSEKNVGQAITYYKSAIAKHPTPHAYINLANLHRDNNAFFDALFVLQEGVKKFPNDGAINNNLALLFSKANILDSTLYYLDAVDDLPSAIRASEVNRLAILTKKEVVLNLDSLSLLYQSKNNLPAKSNLLAYANKYYNGINEDFNLNTINDFSLNAHTFSYTINSFTNKGATVTDRGNWLANHIEYPMNGEFREMLMFVEGWDQYRNGKIANAMQEWQYLTASNSVMIGHFYHTMALTMLEQNSYLQSIAYFESARSLKVADTLNTALAMLEAGKFEDAAPFILAIDDNTMRSDLLAAAYMEEAELHATNDKIRYLALRYRYNKLDLTGIDTILESFDEIAMRELATLMLTRKFIDQGENMMATVVLGKVPFCTAPDRENMRILLTDYLNIARGDAPELKMDDVYLMEINTPHVVKLYKASEAAAKDEKQKADSLFTTLAIDNPFFIEGVLAAVNYLNATQNTDLAYMVLQKAIDMNKHSIPLIKKFIDQAIEINMSQYAEDALLRLAELVPTNDFDMYAQQVNAKILEKKERMANWDIN